MGRIYDLFMSKYNYTDFHELNLDWLIVAVKQFEYEMDNFVSINAVKYADPIQWNITKQYEKNTIVIDPVTGTAYISAKPVPAGVALSRTDYWNVVFDLSRFITLAAQNFANTYEELPTTTATMATDNDGWIVWDSTLYVAKNDIHVGDMYVPDGNIEKKTVEDFFNMLASALNQEIQDRQDTDDQIVLDMTDLITSKVGIEAQARQDADDQIVLDLTDLITSKVGIEAQQRIDADDALRQMIEQASVLNVINVVSDIGCKDDGSEDCADKINDYLAADTTGRPLFFPYGTFKINDTINILNRDVYILGQVFTRSDITLFRISGKRMRFVFEKLGYSSGTDITSADIASAKATALEVIPDGDICSSIDIVGNYIMCDTGIKFSGYGTGFTQNINVKVDYFLCRTNCVKAESSTGYWINEIIFTGCSFNCYQDTDTSILISLHETTHNNLMNGWRFIGCAFENFNTVFDLESAKVYLTNCRMVRQEGFSATTSKYLKAVNSSVFHEQGYIEFASVDQNFTIDNSVECIITGTINNNGVIGTSCKILNDGTNQFAFIDQNVLGRAFTHTFTANNQSVNCGYSFDLGKGIDINVGAYTGCTVTVVYNNNYRPSATSDSGYYTGFVPVVVTVTGTASVTLATPNALGGGTSHVLAGGSSYLLTRSKTITL